MAKGIPKHGDDLLGELRSSGSHVKATLLFLGHSFRFFCLIPVVLGCRVHCIVFQQPNSHKMVAYTSGSRRPRLYVFVAAFFLAVLGLSFVGFHDVSAMFDTPREVSCLQRSEYQKFHCIIMG